MPNLGTLIIKIYPEEFDWFIEYLNAFPFCLIELSVNCGDLWINEALSTLLYNIEIFSICCHTFSKELFHVTSTRFPKLEELYLRGRATEELDLHLKSLEINGRFEGEPPRFMVECTHDAELHYYLERTNNTRSVSMKHVMVENLQTQITIKAICVSVKTLNLKITAIKSEDDD